jgi:hypothetical protein
MLLLLSVLLLAVLATAQTACPNSKPRNSNPVGCILKTIDISAQMTNPNDITYDHVHKKLIIVDGATGQVGVFTTKGKFVKYIDTTGYTYDVLYAAGVDQYGFLYIVSLDGVLLVFGPGPKYQFLNVIPVEYALDLTVSAAKVAKDRNYIFLSSENPYPVVQAYKIHYVPNYKTATSVKLKAAGSTDIFYSGNYGRLGIAYNPKNGQLGVIGEFYPETIQFYSIDYSNPSALTFAPTYNLTAANSALSQATGITSGLQIDNSGRIVVTDNDGYYDDTLSDSLIFMSSSGSPLGGTTESRLGVVVEGFWSQAAISPTGNEVFFPGQYEGELLLVQGFHTS